MTQQREKILTNRTSSLIVAFTLFVGLGAAVGAAPLGDGVGAKLVAPSPLQQSAPAAQRTLSDAPALRLVRSGDDEHCIAIAETHGADGRVYATRGAMCGEP